MERVFVYGTLRRGEGNHAHFLGRAKAAGTGRTVERMTLLNLGAFPAALAIGGPGPIVGELYDVDAGTLARLDRLEGVPHHYRRERVRIARDGGDVVDAWIYLQAMDGQRFAEVIPSGDWKDRSRRIVSES